MGMRQTSPFVTAVVLAGLLVGLGGCDDRDPCGGITCSGVGTCYVDGSSVLCDCPSAFYPDALLRCLERNDGDPCFGVPCSGYGTCIATGDDLVCDCSPGYHPSEREPLNCIPDARDALVPDDGSSPEEGVDTPPDTVDDAAAADDAAGETAPVCGNGVREPGEACERGDTIDCEKCGHQDCRSDCSGYGSCVDQGICDPGDPWDCGECGTGVCTDACEYRCSCTPSDDDCWVDESSVCGVCGSGELCYRACPGTRDCTWVPAASQCAWTACTRSGTGCTTWEC